MSGDGLPVAVDWFGLPPQAGGGGRTAGLGVALWRLDRDEPWEFRAAPMSGTHMICAHLSGSIDWRARTDDRSYARPCLPGTSCMARAGESAEVALRDAHASFVHFYVPAAWLAGCVEELAPGQRAEAIELLDPMNAGTPQIARCALAAAQALREGGVAARLEIEAAGLVLAAALIRHHSSAARRVRGLTQRGGLAPWQLRRVVEAMDQAEDTPPLATLAALVGLSPAHFCTAFRRSTGKPPHAWQRERRIERAKALLAETGLSLAEVALAVGYADQSGFGAVFRQLTGTTPGRYRDAARP